MLPLRWLLFLLYISQILTVVAATVVLSVVTVTARRVKKPVEQIAKAFKDFAGEENIDLIIRDDDRPPSNFVGDVMKAQTTSLKQLTGSKKFNYKYEKKHTFSNAILLQLNVI